MGEALARVQPQVQPDPQVPGPVAGQVPGGQERPRERRGQDDQDGQGDGVLEDHEGSPLRAARTALRRAARAAPGFRPTAGARAALIGATRSSGMEARGPCRSVTRERNRAVLVAFRGTVPPPWPGRAAADGGAGSGAAAGGDRAFLEHPGAEPGQGRDRRQGQAQQPQDQAAEDGQRGGRVGGHGGGQLLVAGADDRDEGVAGQGVGDRRHGPDGQVPPAGRGRDRVHEHAGGDRGQVQRPGPDARGGRARPGRCPGRRRPARRRRGWLPPGRRPPAGGGWRRPSGTGR